MACYNTNLYSSTGQNWTKLTRRGGAVFKLFQVVIQAFPKVLGTTKTTTIATLKCTRICKLEYISKVTEKLNLDRVLTSWNKQKGLVESGRQII